MQAQTARAMLLAAEAHLSCSCQRLGPIQLGRKQLRCWCAGSRRVRTYLLAQVLEEGGRQQRSTPRGLELHLLRVRG